jgi:hypothetical protein
MDLMAKLSNLGPKPGSQPEKPQESTKKAANSPASDPKKAETKPAESKNPFDLDVVSTEEPKTEVKTVEENAPQELKPEAQTKWKELKSKATELDQIKPEYEALKAEVAKLKETPNKLPPEIESEMTELKRFKAAYDVENTPEYQSSVLQPYEKNMGRIAEVADFAGVPMERLEAALKEGNTLARARAIKAALESNLEGPEISSEEIGIVVRAADELHANVFPKDRELRDKALEIQNSLKGQQETLTAKQQEAREQTLQTSASELYSVMEAKLKPMGIFNNQDLVEALKMARPADPSKEPMTAVGQAMSAKLVPVLVGEYNKLATQLKEAKAALRARGEAGAGPGEGGRQSEVKKTSGEPDEGRSLLSGLSGLLRRP